MPGGWPLLARGLRWQVWSTAYTGRNVGQRGRTGGNMSIGAWRESVSLVSLFLALHIRGRIRTCAHVRAHACTHLLQTHMYFFYLDA